MLLLLLACADPPAPAVPVATAPPAGPETWTLTGRHAPGYLLEPPLPEGPERLGADCVTVNTALRGDGPPCLAERWSTPTRSVLLLRAGSRARLEWSDGRTTPTPTRWETLGHVLATCLGDPFTVPPAGDPGALRTFTGTAWTLELTGQNPCRLAGRLVLPAVPGRADWDALTVDGKRWTDGGREAAEPAQQALVRAAIVTRLPELDADGRAAALLALVGDESAEAEALRARLRR